MAEELRSGEGANDGEPPQGRTEDARPDIVANQSSGEEILDLGSAVFYLVFVWLIFALGPGSAHGAFGTDPRDWHVFWIRIPVGFHLPVGYVLAAVLFAYFVLRSSIRRLAPDRVYSVGESVFLFIAYLSAIVGLFASLYVQASHDSHGACFGTPISKLDAVYFTLGTLSTAGTGRFTARTQQCIALTTIQLVIGLIVVALGLAALVYRLTSD